MLHNEIDLNSIKDDVIATFGTNVIEVTLTCFNSCLICEKVQDSYHDIGFYGTPTSTKKTCIKTINPMSLVIVYKQDNLLNFRGEDQRV